MSSGKLQDKILYSRLKNKDKEAFIKAYDLYLDDIYRFLYFKVGNSQEAEDLTSTAFLKTWDYIQNSSITDFKTLKSLLYKVARNLVIDHYRKKSTQTVIHKDDGSLANTVDKSHDIAKEAELVFDVKIIKEKIFELKDEYREVIILRYINELSISEIAVALDKSNGNIRVILYRALKALREIIDQEM